MVLPNDSSFFQSLLSSSSVLLFSQGSVRVAEAIRRDFDDQRNKDVSTGEEDDDCSCC